MSKQVKGTTVQDIQKILTQTQNELKQAQVDTQKIRESQKLSRERLNQLKQKDMEIKKAITSINQTKREAQRTKTTKIPKSTKQKIMEAIKPPSLDTSKSPINTLAKQSKTYHKAGGLDRGVSGRGNKPKNMNEYINRLKYLGSQLTIGGLKEFTYPASANLGKPEDLGETVLQIAGGLLTPSPVDLAATVALAKLTKTKTGQKIINKIYHWKLKAKNVLDPLPPLSTREQVEFEKLIFDGKLTPDDLKKLDIETLEKLATGKYKPLEAAGAAVVSDELLYYDIAITNLDWTDDQYINFLAAYGKELSPDLAVAILSNLPDSKRKEIIGTATDDIEKLREAYNEIIDKPTPPPEETITETPPIPDEEDDTTPAPPREEEDHDIPTPTIPIPDVIEDIDDPTPDPEPPPPTEPIILTPKDKDELKRNRVKLYNGPITEFRVTFHYKNGVKQSTKIKARSYPEALNKAQFNRSGNKRVLKIIDLEKVK